MGDSDDFGPTGPALPEVAEPLAVPPRPYEPPSLEDSRENTDGDWALAYNLNKKEKDQEFLRKQQEALDHYYAGKLNSDQDAEYARQLQKEINGVRQVPHKQNRKAMRGHSRRR